MRPINHVAGRFVTEEITLTQLRWGRRELVRPIGGAGGRIGGLIAHLQVYAWDGGLVFVALHGDVWASDIEDQGAGVDAAGFGLERDQSFEFH